MDIKKILKALNEAKNNAYTPISNRNVGCVILTNDNHLIKGANVQSVISGLGCCAEASAIYNAVAQGKYNFKQIYIISDSDKIKGPCGACLQLIHEFSEIRNKDIKIFVYYKNKLINTTSVRKLLKDGYGPVTAGKDISKYK